MSATILSGNDGVVKDLQALKTSILHAAPEAVVDSIASRWYYCLGDIFLQ